MKNEVPALAFVAMRGEARSEYLVYLGCHCLCRLSTIPPLLDSVHCMERKWQIAAIGLVILASERIL